MSVVAKNTETNQEANTTDLQEHEENTGSQSDAYNAETGEINWDCPCIAGMVKPPCGDTFKSAFSCFVYSTEEPKGASCVEHFREMQKCFREYPDVYGEELEDEEEEVQALEAKRNAERLCIYRMAERPEAVSPKIQNLVPEQAHLNIPDDDNDYLPSPVLLSTPQAFPLLEGEDSIYYNNFVTASDLKYSASSSENTVNEVKADSHIEQTDTMSPSSIKTVTQTLNFKLPSELHMSFPLKPQDGLGPSPIVRFSGIKRTIAEADSLYMCYQERNRSEVSRMFVKGVTLNGLTSYKIIIHFVFDRPSTYMTALKTWPEKVRAFLQTEEEGGALPNVQYAMPSVSKTQYFDQQFHAIIVVKQESEPFPSERLSALLRILLQVSIVKSTQDYSTMLIGGLKLILP
ncbi:Oxidoreductase [Nowakowskiella sp. JEL0078]|nr:Oxidoreductase [Nowakowskiella sp. JEL0078]